MDTDAAVRAQAAGRLVSEGASVRVDVTVVRGERKATQHLFLKGQKVSLCGEWGVRGTNPQALSLHMTMCRGCMESEAFAGAVREVLRAPLGNLAPAVGFSLPSTRKRTSFKQEGLPEEWLPTGSGAKGSSW